MTALGLLNFLVLQWFGVRLARSRVAICTSLDVDIGDAMSIFSSSRGEQRGRVVAIDSGTVTLQWYTLLRWVWPLTGWWSDYRWIARRS